MILIDTLLINPQKSFMWLFIIICILKGETEVQRGEAV